MCAFSLVRPDPTPRPDPAIETLAKPQPAVPCVRHSGTFAAPASPAAHFPCAMCRKGVPDMQPLPYSARRIRFTCGPPREGASDAKRAAGRGKATVWPTGNVDPASIACRKRLTVNKWPVLCGTERAKGASRTDIPDPRQGRPTRLALRRQRLVDVPSSRRPAGDRSRRPSPLPRSATSIRCCAEKPSGCSPATTGAYTTGYPPGTRAIPVGSMKAWVRPTEPRSASHHVSQRMEKKKRIYGHPHPTPSAT